VRRDGGGAWAGVPAAGCLEGRYQEAEGIIYRGRDFRATCCRCRATPLYPSASESCRGRRCRLKRLGACAYASLSIFLLVASLKHGAILERAEQEAALRQAASANIETQALRSPLSWQRTLLLSPQNLTLEALALILGTR